MAPGFGLVNRRRADGKVIGRPGTRSSRVPHLRRSSF